MSVCITSAKGPYAHTTDHKLALEMVAAINKQLGKPALWLVPVDPKSAPPQGLRLVKGQKL